jgi:predicted phage gp36 major capsid-like protein
MTDTQTAAYVDAAAREAGLAIPPERRAATLMNFARIAAMAALVNGLDVDAATVDPAPVFRHD